MSADIKNKSQNKISPCLETSNNILSEMGKKALIYAKSGYYIFPVKPREKKPLTPNGFKDATTDLEQIKRWWTKHPNANIGMDIKKSNLMIIDPDRHNKEKDGVAEFKKLRGNNPLPNTPISKTGGDGRHIVFKKPKGKKLKSKISESIDVKVNGYIVVPPSITEKPYEWREGYSIFDLEPADCPEWLIEHIIEEEKLPIIKFNKEYPPSSSDLIIQRCGFLKHCCLDDAENLPENDWTFGTIGILSHSIEAPEIVHTYSNVYSNYSYEETQYKINHFLENSGPTTCETIQEKCGEDYCKDCPYNGVIKSPIILGYASKPSNDTIKNTTFPVEYLPKLFQEYSNAATTAIGCPKGFIPCALLAFSASLIGTSRKARLKPEWEQYCNLWVMIVGRPSSKKSPALNAVSCFIDEIEKRNYKDYEKAKILYEVEKAEYDLELNRWKKKPTDFAPPCKPNVPKLKALSSTDITKEALCELLSENLMGIILVNDELSAWLRSMNQYKGGSGSDRSDYLSMWSAQRITVHRKEKEPIHIDSAFLSIIGAIQPDVLQGMKYNADDGLNQRFLYCCDEISYEPVSECSEIGIALKNAIKSCFDYLLGLRKEQPEIMDLSEEAREYFIDIENKIYRKVTSDDFNTDLEAFYIKMISYVGRLSLVLHMIKIATNETTSEVIELETIKQAESIAKYFSKQSEKAFKMISETPEEKIIAKLVAWIKKKALISVTPRDIMQAGVLGKNIKASYATDKLALLQDYGYGFWNKDKRKFIFYTN